jgi:hypothetical protein
MAGINQPRDYHGRWTVGGSGAVPQSRSNLKYNKRTGKVSGSSTAYYGGKRGVSMHSYAGSRPRVSLNAQRSSTVRGYAATNKRRVGSPVGGSRNLRLVATRTSVTRGSQGATRSVITGSRFQNRRAAGSYNRTGKAPTGSYVVAYNPKG